MSTDYSEIFCTAVDEIVSAKLAGLEYDITKTCTIIDDSNKKTGKYRVSSGAAKFDAYAVAGEYSNGETVLVTIPNGNYDLQKIIVGRSVTETKIPTKYTSPLSEMTQIKDYTFKSNQSVSLLANATTEGSVTDIGINITRTDLTGFTKLGVSADFKAWLLDMDASSGDYGLKLTLAYDGMLAQGSYGTKYETLYFKASDMIGNPYGFESFYSQEKVFDISHINTVKNVTIQFYQRDNFKDSSGTLIPSKGYNYNSLVNREFTEIEYNLVIEAANTNLDVLLRTLNLTEVEAMALARETFPWAELSDFIELFLEGFNTGSPMENNLFVKNVKLYFGYEANIFTEDNKLVLYTDNGLTYHYTKDNNKHIYIRWIHKIKDGVYEILDNNEVDFSKHKVRWFKENIGYAPPEGEELDPYAGANWEPLTKDEGLESLEYIFLPRAGDETTAGVQEEKVKAIVVYTTNVMNGFELEESIQTYESDIITFKNEEKAADSQAFAGSTIFKIVCRDGSEGSYLIYNQSGKINNEGAGRGYARYVDITYQDIPLERLKEIGMRVDWIKWYFPVSNTMLLTSQTLQEENDGVKSERYKSFDESDSTLYYEITRSIVRDSGSGSILPKSQQGFSIKNQWNYGDKNNTVRCKASINGTVYENAINLRFGKAGTNGTNQTFVIECEENKNALIINDRGVTVPNTLTVTAKIYDSNGKEKELSTEESNKISWSWYKKTTVAEDYIKLPDKRQGQSIKLTCGTNEFKEDNYYILQATYFGNNDNPTLKAYFPVPLKTKNTVKMEGAREVIYNSQGNPSYYSDAYVLYYLKNLKETQIKHGWEIISEDDDNDPMGYLPKLKALGSVASGVGLSASPMYTSGYSDKVCVYIYNEENKYGWAQPILIMKSPYDFPMLNEWDGTLTMNEKNGTILSTMLGAGHKNADNTFSGVLIGDVGAAGGEASETGVYGFHQGEVSYALKEGGTATFGKAGRGQIHIDGNTGTIKSGNYAGEKPVGMKIDLDDGIIDIRSSHEGSEAKVSMSPGKNEQGSNIPYFSIVGNSGRDIIKIAKDEYCLQSENWVASMESNVKGEPTEGSRISLNDGQIDMRSPAGNVVLSSSGSQNNPFFSINNGHKDLFHCSNEGYYLQSLNYNELKLRDRKGFTDATKNYEEQDLLSLSKLIVNGYSTNDSDETGSALSNDDTIYTEVTQYFIGYYNQDTSQFIPILADRTYVTEPKNQSTFKKYIIIQDVNKNWTNDSNHYDYRGPAKWENLPTITNDDELLATAYYVRERHDSDDINSNEVYFRRLTTVEKYNEALANHWLIFKDFRIEYRLNEAKTFTITDDVIDLYSEHTITPNSNNNQIASVNFPYRVDSTAVKIIGTGHIIKKDPIPDMGDIFNPEEKMGFRCIVTVTSKNENQQIITTTVNYPSLEAQESDTIFRYGDYNYQIFSDNESEIISIAEGETITQIELIICNNNSAISIADIKKSNFQLIQVDKNDDRIKLNVKQSQWLKNGLTKPKYVLDGPLTYSAASLYSANEAVSMGQGFKFDLSKDTITSYSLKMNGFNGYNKITLDFNAPNFPLVIGGRFRVDWNGNIIMQKASTSDLINVTDYLLDIIGDNEKYVYKY